MISERHSGGESRVAVGAVDNSWHLSPYTCINLGFLTSWNRVITHENCHMLAVYVRRVINIQTGDLSLPAGSMETLLPRRDS